MESICCVTSCSSPNFGFSWKTTFILSKPSLEGRNSSFSFNWLEPNVLTALSAVYPDHSCNWEYVLGIFSNVEPEVSYHTVYHEPSSCYSDHWKTRITDNQSSIREKSEMTSRRSTRLRREKRFYLQGCSRMQKYIQVIIWHSKYSFHRTQLPMRDLLFFDWNCRRFFWSYSLFHYVCGDCFQIRPLASAFHWHERWHFPRHRSSLHCSAHCSYSSMCSNALTHHRSAVLGQQERSMDVLQYSNRPRDEDWPVEQRRRLSISNRLMILRNSVTSFIFLDHRLSIGHGTDLFGLFGHLV